jgi:serine/threonine-protein kinase RsbW
MSMHLVYSRKAADNQATEVLTVPATLDSLAHISAFIAGATAQAGLDEHTAWQVELAIDEAATNIIEHAYDAGASGAIKLTWQLSGDELIITLHDWGRQFDPSAVPSPDVDASLDDRQAGGLGMFLMNKLMDTVRYEFDEQHGNMLTMTKHINRSSEAPQVFGLSGRLDASGTDQELERVRTAIGNGVRHILLDMGDVSFMSSSGLRALLLLRKDVLARNGVLRLCALQPQVLEVFSITGFTQVFAIHRTREDALAAFGQGAP